MIAALAIMAESTTKFGMETYNFTKQIFGCAFHDL
jgi:hypothetical protein